MTLGQLARHYTLWVEAMFRGEDCVHYAGRALSCLALRREAALGRDFDNRFDLVLQHYSVPKMNLIPLRLLLLELLATSPSATVAASVLLESREVHLKYRMAGYVAENRTLEVSPVDKWE